MIAADYLKRIAAWSRELNEREIEVARAGIVEKSYRANEHIFMRGDAFDYWTGIVTGLARMSTVSSGGKAATFAGLTAGAWFGEGTVLKNEPRRYDVVALRDTRLALMDRTTFFWLFENSVAFNRYLVKQFNERLGQFIALVEYDRMLCHAQVQCLIHIAVDIAELDIECVDCGSKCQVFMSLLAGSPAVT
jgi:CRP-like cAMP-binding protein